MRVVTMYSLTSSRPLCHLWLLSYFLAVSFALWFQLSFPYVQLYLQPHISHKLPYSSAYPASKYIRFQTEVIIFSPKSFLFLFFLLSFLTHYWGFFFFLFCPATWIKKVLIILPCQDFSHILPPFYSPCYYPISLRFSFPFIFGHMVMSLPNQDTFECKRDIMESEEGF